MILNEITRQNAIKTLLQNRCFLKIDFRGDFYKICLLKQSFSKSVICSQMLKVDIYMVQSIFMKIAETYRIMANTIKYAVLGYLNCANLVKINNFQRFNLTAIT